MEKEEGLNINSIIRRSNSAASFGVVYGLIISGAFFTGFALQLGANNFQIGCLAALPFLATIFQVFSSYWIEKKRLSRKKTWITLYSIHRPLWILIAVLPFLLVSPVLRLYIFFLLVALSYIMGALPAPAWWSWLADLIPEEIRGRFFGRRNAILGAVTLVGAVTLSWLLDRFPKENNFLGFGLIFSLAGLSGYIDVFIHNFIPEPEVKEKPDLPSFLHAFKRPFKNASFRRFALFFAAWTFSLQIMVPFANVFLLEKLKLNYFTISLFVVIFLAFNIIFSNIWGPLLDKIGHKRILNVCGWGVTFIPLYWVFCTPDYILPLFIVHIIAGIFWPGIEIISPRLLLGLSPKENRSIYVANFTLLVGLAGLLASLLAGLISQLLHNFSFTVKGFEIDSLKILFILSSLLRCLCLIFKPSLGEEILRDGQPVKAFQFNPLKLLKGILGVILLAIGLAGLLLPIFPGIPFILLGSALLGIPLETYKKILGRAWTHLKAIFKR